MVTDVRSALIAQWELIMEAADGIDLSAPSRCAGWTNREVLAHLHVQPTLVARFLRTVGSDRAALGVTENLSGTRSYRDLIDASAREGAAQNKVDLRGPVDAVRARASWGRIWLPRSRRCRGRSRSRTTSSRGASRPSCTGVILSVVPDPVAQAVASKALLDTLWASAPELVAEAGLLPATRWIALATGRAGATGRLADVLPLMV